jgi:two-component system cell cycle sensor histidine kinase/response regulator CckA
MDASTHQHIRQLLDDYLRMYAGRDDRLTEYFSADFSGFTGGGDFLVKDKERWVGITRQDFAQVTEPIRIELKDVAIQSLSTSVAVATSFFRIHLPIKDHVLSRETARLVLIFHLESAGWKIAHSSISIPYFATREGEVYPLHELSVRNQALETIIAERTRQLSEANESLRQTNEALQRSELRYRSILNASPDDITITDREGRIIMVSPMAFTLFRGRQDAQFQGRPVTDFIVPEDRARAVERITHKRQGIPTGASEYRGLRPDGSTFDIEVNSDFIRDASGEVTGMVLIVRDITERKQAEAARARLEAINRRLQKSESLGRMAEAIAHHFNNQLQAVMLSLELASNELPPGDGPATRIELAMRSARKAAEVSTQMLTYLGQTEDKHELLDLSAECQQSLTLLRVAIPQSVKLTTDLPSPGPIVRGSSHQFQQVLTNLVTNAWEASRGQPGAVRLTVKTMPATEIPEENRFPLDWQPRAHAYGCLEVADAGCGIAPKDFEKIFDPFFSTKFSGRGLGLAVVLGIARAHQGAVSVGSEAGRGSTFRIYFPLTTAGAPAPTLPIPRAAAPRSARGVTVLVIDDESAVRKTLALALPRYGFTVHAAEDGVAALEIFRQRHSEIDCVVCDLTMPRLNGWETLHALRQLAPRIPVILASGYSGARALEGEHQDHPNAFLQKPYELKTLVSSLNAILAGPM